MDYLEIFLASLTGSQKKSHSYVWCWVWPERSLLCLLIVVTVETPLLSFCWSLLGGLCHSILACCRLSDIACSQWSIWFFIPSLLSRPFRVFGWCLVLWSKFVFLILETVWPFSLISIIALSWKCGIPFMWLSLLSCAFLFTQLLLFQPVVQPSSSISVIVVWLDGIPHQCVG